MLLAKLADGATDHLFGESFAAYHRHCSTLQAAQRLYLCQHVMAVRHVLAVVVDDECPRLGGHHTLAMTFDQSRAHFLFQQADLAADGRGCYAELFGSAAY